jgi:hypothetical protein
MGDVYRNGKGKINSYDQMDYIHLEYVMTITRGSDGILTVTIINYKVEVENTYLFSNMSDFRSLVS